MNEADFARMQADLTHIRSDVKDIKEDMHNRYVTKDQFEPVRMVVYGMVGLILVGVIGALLTLVVVQ